MDYRAAKLNPQKRLKIVGRQRESQFGLAVSYLVPVLYKPFFLHHLNPAQTTAYYGGRKLKARIIFTSWSFLSCIFITYLGTFYICLNALLHAGNIG
jgi:hypothetical protein